MCGIFGIVIESQKSINTSVYKSIMDKLFKLSESRGKEAAGVAYLGNNAIYIAKFAEAPSAIIKRDEYKKIYKYLQDDINQSKVAKTNCKVCIIGHSRLVTNGGQQTHSNNQPAIADGIVAIHNGIITNVNSLWKKHSKFKKETQLDTEIILRLIRKFFHSSQNLTKAVQNTFMEIEGAASIAALFTDLNCILLATNTGSLYYRFAEKGQNFIFASEKFILDTLNKNSIVKGLYGTGDTVHLKAGQGLIINLNDNSVTKISLINHTNQHKSFNLIISAEKEIVDLSLEFNSNKNQSRIRGEGPYSIPTNFKDQYPDNKILVDNLRRCTKCVLPETMPFIKFDNMGVCNYCNNYTKIEQFGEENLRKMLEPFRKKDGSPDCLVTFSGGRDSSFGLHYIKKVLGLNPITYTYDWGMITDLGRRNQMRMCGNLGVEQILVSADIAKKRENIRLNINAWLRQPDLGTIPLFMAGDKQYFYFANKVSTQTRSKLIVLCENLLETTRFKSGYCGIPPRHGSTHTYSLTIPDRVKLSAYYAKQFITNPSFINKSIIDTLSAYASYYLMPHEYLNLYQYIRWDEKEINDTLINEYHWETADDTTTTWRIGDGTASFYNYIYYTMGGLTEIDTFRSNQIREGMLNRSEAMNLIKKENEPRYESIQWYCDIIGIDFQKTIEKINSSPKRYNH